MLILLAIFVLVHNSINAYSALNSYMKLLLTYSTFPCRDKCDNYPQNVAQYRELQKRLLLRSFNAQIQSFGKMMKYKV
jgi:hypothetical protein